MNSLSSATRPRLPLVSAPAILLLLGWLGFPHSAAAAEVRVPPWFSPKPAVTGDDLSSSTGGIGPGTTNREPDASQAVFSLGSGSDFPSSTNRRVVDQQSGATQPSEMPPGAKVTRDQAIAIALKAVRGRATSVEIEEKLGRNVYTVEVMTSSGNETDVFVDVGSGEVVGTEQ
jgi:peptidase YpeB-like protein